MVIKNVGILVTAAPFHRDSLVVLADHLSPGSLEFLLHLSSCILTAAHHCRPLARVPADYGTRRGPPPEHVILCPSREISAGFISRAGTNVRRCAYFLPENRVPPLALRTIPA